MNMLFPRYVWLTYSDEIGTLNINNNNINCGEGSLVEAIEGLFTLRSVGESQRGDGDHNNDNTLPQVRQVGGIMRILVM